MAAIALAAQDGQDLLREVHGRIDGSWKVFATGPVGEDHRQEKRANHYLSESRALVSNRTNASPSDFAPSINTPGSRKGRGDLMESFHVAFVEDLGASLPWY